ncbi:cell division protein, partial [Francisella tularensis subsp. holarctica]|nr:cell division protein [Francisella tularensis subsp. holarctica]
MDIKSNSFFYIFISVVLVLISILQYNLWFSNTGFIKYQAL